AVAPLRALLAGLPPDCPAATSRTASARRRGNALAAETHQERAREDDGHARVIRRALMKTSDQTGEGRDVFRRKPGGSPPLSLTALRRARMVEAGTMTPAHHRASEATTLGEEDPCGTGHRDRGRTTA
ncbi:hypothetical protein, partial [Methylobacterium tarhaniae]|uniref:hypothetical protein n=1 Tax=Methylobacterium tarhaniae TaxID=1187852 RepID=UPI001ABF8AB4